MAVSFGCALSVVNSCLRYNTSDFNQVRFLRQFAHSIFLQNVLNPDVNMTLDEGRLRENLNADYKYSITESPAHLIAKGAMHSNLEISLTNRN